MHPGGPQWNPPPWRVAASACLSVVRVQTPKKKEKKRTFQKIIFPVKYISIISGSRAPRFGRMIDYFITPLGTLPQPDRVIKSRETHMVAVI
jgi:hypothetical protein